MFWVVVIGVVVVIWWAAAKAKREDAQESVPQQKAPSTMSLMMDDVVSASEAVSKVANSISMGLERSMAIRKAVRPLDESIYRERTCVRICLESARRTLEIQNRGKEFQETFERIRQELAAKMDALEPRQAAEKVPVGTSPEVVIIVPQRFPGIVDEVASRQEEMRRDRRQDLLATFREMGREVGLQGLFWAKLDKMEQPGIRDGLKQFARREGLL